jgi:hypothetical protein
VGAATLALLRERKYRNLYYDDAFKPGIHKSNHDEWVSLLVEAIIGNLKLYGEDTLFQLRGYRSDKTIERTVRAELLSTNGGRRRGRHHWDKVSALMVACALAPYVPTRYRPVEKPDNVIPFGDMTWEQIKAYKKVAKPRPARSRRAHYRRR